MSREDRVYTFTACAGCGLLHVLDDDDGCDDDHDAGPDSYEDELRAARGTSGCDGLCDPQCDWCLASHLCPDECTPGTCPYEALDARLDRVQRGGS